MPKHWHRICTGINKPVKREHMNTPITAKLSVFDIQQISVPRLQQAGIAFNCPDRGTISNWIARALLTPGNQTLVFADSLSLLRVQADSLAMEMLKHADLVIPRGRSLRTQLRGLGRAGRGDIDTSHLYDELFMEIEHRQLHLCLLASNASEAQRVERALLQHYPSLTYSIHILEERYRFSTAEMAASMRERGVRVILSLLESPQQERVLSRLNRYLNDSLLIGLGSGLADSLFGLRPGQPRQLQQLKLWFRQRRHSILLRPLHWLGLLCNLLMGPFNNSEHGLPLNSSLNRSGWRTRQLRAAIFLKAMSFRGRRQLGVLFKRLLDLIGVGTGMLLLSPLLLFVALVIKLTSKGPVFYSQIRVGLNGRHFRIWKFRSMYTDADKRKAELEAQNEMAGGVLFKMKRDPRITPIGRIIRRLSIDELPQLFNVLTGEMSLVGPRPALPQEVEAYPVLARARLEVKPGLTGLWQISGRSDLPFDKQVLLDTAYVHTQSTTNDIKLIAKTIPAVISGKGAY